MNAKHFFQAVLAIALAAICSTGYTQNNDSSVSDTTRPRTSLPEEDTTIRIIENMPEFPCGEVGLRKYLEENTIYPEEAKNKGLEGKVFVSFVVSETGDIENVKVSRGIDPLLDKEAIRVVQSIPKEILPKTVQHGKPVRMAYTIAVIVPLEKTE